MAAFTTELQALLDEHGDRYYTRAFVGDGIEHVTTKSTEEHRWFVVKLDVYRRKADGALAGVMWNDPATEIQEDQDRDPEVTKVEAFMTTDYRAVVDTDAQDDDVPPNAGSVS